MRTRGVTPISEASRQEPRKDPPLLGEVPDGGSSSDTKKTQPINFYYGGPPGDLPGKRNAHSAAPGTVLPTESHQPLRGSKWGTNRMGSELNLPFISVKAVLLVNNTKTPKTLRLLSPL